MIRPGTSELWVAHLMLGTDTPQPTLDFQSTVFPALSVFDGGGHAARAPLGRGEPGRRRRAGRHRVGAARDRVLGRRTIRVRRRRRQRGRARHRRGQPRRGDDRAAAARAPARGARLEPRASSTCRSATARTSRPSRSTPRDGGLSIAADGAPFKSLAIDPMPAEPAARAEALLLGQQRRRADDPEPLGLVRDVPPRGAKHAASRGRSSRASRDAPSNAGGMLGTGFLFRTADRSQVQDYWKTIDQEQGGHFSPYDQAEPSQKAASRRARRLRQLRDPRARAADADGRRRRWRAASSSSTTRRGPACTCCHSGPNRTDSGSGNPTLDLARAGPPARRGHVRDQRRRGPTSRTTTSTGSRARPAPSTRRRSGGCRTRRRTCTTGAPRRSTP